MKKIVKLTESDLVRIVKKVISENKITDYSDLYKILPKTKLYNFLDNITKVRMQIGSVGGGLRFVIYDQDGSKEEDLSLNGFNSNKTKQLLKYKISEEYLTDEMVDELKSIQRRRTDSFYTKSSIGDDITDLIMIIINIITNREPDHDTLEDIFDRHFENKNWCEGVNRVLNSGEMSLDQIKEKFFDNISYYYTSEFIDNKELKRVVSKKIDNCIN